MPNNDTDSRLSSNIQVEYLFRYHVIFWGGGHQKITLDYMGEGEGLGINVMHMQNRHIQNSCKECFMYYHSEHNMFYFQEN